MEPLMIIALVAAWFVYSGVVPTYWLMAIALSLLVAFGLFVVWSHVAHKIYVRVDARKYDMSHLAGISEEAGTITMTAEQLRNLSKFAVVFWNQDGCFYRGYKVILAEHPPQGRGTRLAPLLG